MVETRAVRRAKALLDGLAESSNRESDPLSSSGGELEFFTNTYKRREIQPFSTINKVVSLFHVQTLMYYSV